MEDITEAQGLEPVEIKHVCLKKGPTLPDTTSRMVCGREDKLLDVDKYIASRETRHGSKTRRWRLASPILPSLFGYSREVNSDSSITAERGFGFGM